MVAVPFACTDRRCGPWPVRAASGNGVAAPSSTMSGRLRGLPIAVKDNFCVRGWPCTAGSGVLQGFKPNYDAFVVERLRAAGCEFTGKAEMDEFGMGSFNPAVTNPWSPLVTAGGSSGGSAAAVASGAAFAALGSDTGGSVRLPASFCGVVGMKPTYGRLSRWGLVAYASSLDCPGILATSVEETARVLEVIDGFDPRDPNAVKCEPFDAGRALAANGDRLDGITVGIPDEFNVEELTADVRQAWQTAVDWAIGAGARVVRVSMPAVRYSLPAYYIIVPAEAASNLSRYDGTRFGRSEVVYDDQKEPAFHSLSDLITKNRTIGFGDEVKRRIMIGTFVLSSVHYSAFFKQAQRVRAWIMQDFQRAFQSGVDVLLTPTAISDAPLRADLERSMKDDPMSSYFHDAMTVPSSLAGLPSVSVPCSLSSSGLPLGLQIIGNAFQEETVLGVASVIERRAQFQRPAAMMSPRIN